MGFDDPFRDGEAEAGAAGVAGAGLVGAVEAFEDVGEVVGSDAEAGVFDGEEGAVVGGRESDGDAAAGPVVADGVGDEVGEEFAEAVEVAGRADVGGRVEGQLEGVFFGEGT